MCNSYLVYEFLKYCLLVRVLILKIGLISGKQTLRFGERYNSIISLYTLTVFLLQSLKSHDIFYRMFWKKS